LKPHKQSTPRAFVAPCGVGWLFSSWRLQAAANPYCPAVYLPIRPDTSWSAINPSDPAVRSVGSVYFAVPHIVDYDGRRLSQAHFLRSWNVSRISIQSYAACLLVMSCVARFTRL